MANTSFIRNLFEERTGNVTEFDAWLKDQHQQPLQGLVVAITDDQDLIKGLRLGILDILEATSDDNTNPITAAQLALTAVAHFQAFTSRHTRKHTQ